MHINFPSSCLNRFAGKSALFKQSLNNAGWSLVDYIVLPALFFIFTPFFVKTLGIEIYGLWMLINTFTGFSGIVTFGLTDGTIKYVSKYRIHKDEEKIASVINTSLGIFFIVGISLFLALYFSANSLVGNIFKISTSNANLGIAAFKLGAASIFLRLIDQVYSSALYGFERYDIVSKVNIPFNVLTVLANVVLLKLGYGVKGILIASICSLLLSATIKACFLSTKSLNGVILLPRICSNTLKEMLEFGFHSWLQGLGALLLGQADRLLIAAMVGTQGLAYYSVCQQLTQQIHIMLTKASAFLFPLFSTMRESNDLVRLNRVYIKALNIISIIAVSIGIPLFLFADSILTLWMGREFALEASNLLQILSFVYTLWATSIAPYYVLNGANYFRLNTALGLAGGGIVAIMTLILIPQFGILGAAFSKLFTLPSSIIGRTLIHYKILHDRRWYAALPIFLPIIIMYFAAYVFQSFINCHPTTILHVILAFITASIVAGGISAVLINFFSRYAPQTTNNV